MKLLKKQLLKYSLAFVQNQQCIRGSKVVPKRFEKRASNHLKPFLSFFVQALRQINCGLNWFALFKTISYGVKTALIKVGIKSLLCLIMVPTMTQATGDLVQE